MICATIDTHALIWYLYDDTRLSSTARNLIENAATSGDQISVSSITLAEMVYLIEKERIDSAALSRLLTALDVSDPIVVEIPVDRRRIEFLSRVPRTEVPDLPDRIIAATALSLNVPVISRDHKIQTSMVTTIW